VFSTVLLVALCDALMLAILVYGLAVGKATTHSYHLDLIALTALCPALFVSLVRNSLISWPLSLCLSIVFAVAFKACATYVACNPSRKSEVSATTLTIISFALFQVVMVVYGLVLSNKSVSLNIGKENLRLFSHWITVPRDKALSIALALSVVVTLLLLDKASKLVVLLRALKENSDLLIQFDYPIVPIFWRGTILAALLASSSGFLLLIRSSVGPITAYNLFFLSFSVLLLVESLSILRILLTAFTITLLFNGVLAVTDGTHQPLTGSVILLLACGVRYFFPAR